MALNRNPRGSLFQTRRCAHPGEPKLNPAMAAPAKWVNWPWIRSKEPSRPEAIWPARKVSLPVYSRKPRSLRFSASRNRRVRLVRCGNTACSCASLFAGFALRSAGHHKVLTPADQPSRKSGARADAASHHKGSEPFIASSRRELR